MILLVLSPLLVRSTENGYSPNRDKVFRASSVTVPTIYCDYDCNTGAGCCAFTLAHDRKDERSKVKKRSGPKSKL